MRDQKTDLSLNWRASSTTQTRETLLKPNRQNKMSIGNGLKGRKIGASEQAANGRHYEFPYDFQRTDDDPLNLRSPLKSVFESSKAHPPHTGARAQRRLRGII